MSPPVLGAARLLAPQPADLPNPPVLQPLQNTYPLKSSRSRRGTVNAACHECRLKKLKCDGMRPRCHRCVAKGHDVCEYTVNPGETRFTALKRKNASLLTESDRMHKFIQALRSASPSRAQAMLQNLRTNDANNDHLSTLTLSKHQPHPLHSQVPDALSPESTSPPLTGTESAHTPWTSRSRSTNLDTQSNQFFPLPATTQPVSDLEGQLPTIEFLRESVKAFQDEAAQIFQVFSPHHVESQFEILSQSTHTEAYRLAACELCTLAAVGSQYSEKSLCHDMQQKAYRVARLALYDLVEASVSRAAKVCVTLCIFNIMSKEKVAMTFVDMGLNLLSRPPIANVCPPNMDRSEWMELRKTWRVLVFLESWLSSTLGYVSGIHLSTEFRNMKNLETEVQASLEDKILTEMIKIAVIKLDMLRLSVSFKDITGLSVETMARDLQHWRQNLPNEMRAAELENNSEMTADLRRTMYYINFLHFGSQIMLLRRVLQGIHEQGNFMTGKDALFNSLIVEAKSAARDSARLFKRLIIEGGIIKRCWICIFHAYSSCVILLHHVAETIYEQQTSGLYLGNPDDDLQHAAVCLEFLDICSSKDAAADQFYARLNGFQPTLQAAVDGRLEYGEDVRDAMIKLHELIRRPFNASDQAGPEFVYLWKEEPRQQTGELVKQSRCYDGWQCIDGIKNDGMIHDLMSAIRPGYFLPGFENHVWKNSRRMSYE